MTQTPEIIIFDPNNSADFGAYYATKTQEYYDVYVAGHPEWEGAYYPEGTFAVALAFDPNAKEIYGAACLSGNDPEQFLVYTTRDGHNYPIYQLDNNLVDENHRNQGIGSALVRSRMEKVAETINESNQPSLVRVGFDPNQAGWGQKVVSIIEATPTIKSDPNSPTLQDYLKKKNSMVHYYVDEGEKEGEEILVIEQQRRPDPKQNVVTISSLSVPFEEDSRIIEALTNYQSGSPKSLPDSLSDKEGLLNWDSIESMPTLEDIAAELGIEIDPNGISVQQEHVFYFEPAQS